MKKLICIFCAVTFCFVLTSCARITYGKYDTLISHLEMGDYEAAHSEIDRICAFDENTTAAQYETVEITMENWQEYFVIEEIFVVNKNQFDEVSNIFKSYCFKLRDGYSMSETDTSIAVEFDYLKEWRSVTVDKAGETLTVGELVEGRDAEPSVGNMFTVCREETDMIPSRSWSGDTQAVPCNVEIKRIQGQLVIAK